MNIAVIGASAGIGLQAVKQALEKGHTVRALSRNTATIDDNSLLTKINGSADSVEDLKTAIMGTDAVLITVGTKKKKGTRLFSDIARTLIKATTELEYTGTVIIVTGFGTGESSGYLSFLCALQLIYF